MREILEMTDKYCAQTTWKTIALLKTCLLSMGMLMGMAVPREKRKIVTAIAGIVFIVTYVPVMLDFCKAIYKSE